MISTRLYPSTLAETAWQGHDNHVCMDGTVCVESIGHHSMDTSAQKPLTFESIGATICYVMFDRCIVSFAFLS